MKNLWKLCLCSLWILIGTFGAPPNLAAVDAVYTDKWTYVGGQLGLYQINNNSTQISQITHDYSAHGLHASGNWLYYTAWDNIARVTNIYRVKSNGDEKQKLADDSNIIGIYDNWVFYSRPVRDGDRRIIHAQIWKMALDGSNRQIVLDKVDGSASLLKDSIYYFYNSEWWLLDLSTGSKQKYLLGKYARCATEWDGWIYYLDTSGDTAEIWRADRNSNHREKLFSGEITYLTIANDKLYYISDNQLFVADLNGKINSKIADQEAFAGQSIGSFVVAGDWGYYETETHDSENYRIRLDGSGRELLEEAIIKENIAYYQKYLSLWGFYCPFERDYTEQDFAKDFNLYLLYSSCLRLDGVTEGKIPGYFPAKQVEDTIIRHFPVNAQQLRASLPKDEYGGDHYDPAKNAYYFEGGYGGASMNGIVVLAQKREDCLILSCNWFDEEVSFRLSHQVTIRLGQSENEFYYMENTVIDRAASED